MNKPLARLLWGVIAILGAVSLGAIALHRGEPINALWLVVAATCCYAGLSLLQRIYLDKSPGA